MENRNPQIEPSLPIQFQLLYDEMTTDINQLRQTSTGQILTVARGCMQLVGLSMFKLKALVAGSEFQTKEEEIFFFKHVKPEFHAHFIFWSYVFNIELLRPIGGKEQAYKYLRRQLHKLNSFFASHAGFYSYYRSGETLMDEAYFLRERMDYTVANPHAVDSDRSFSTNRDYMIARIKANEMLQEYLTNEISTNEQEKAEQQSSSSGPLLHWTASKAGLVELVYALQSAGVYNNGKAEIKEIAQYFESLFEVDLGNYYHTFNEIRLRKKNRTQLIDQMRERLLKKMDELDEK